MAVELVVMLPEAASRLLGRHGRDLADVTGLLDEWAVFLSPKAAARQAALAGCASFDGWAATGKTAASNAIMRAAREVAEDEVFIGSLAASSSLCRFVEEGRLTERGLAVVLGFGVLAAMRVGIGLQGVELRRKSREARSDADERRSDSEASEECPTLAPLGRSVPWADDAVAEATRESEAEGRASRS